MEIMASKRMPSMDLVRQIAAEESASVGIDPRLIFGQDRRALVSWLRARCVHRLRAYGTYSIYGIAKVLGMHHTSVLYAMRRELPTSPPRSWPRKKRHGETNGHSKLTADQVIQIRAAPESEARTAERFGISPSHVHDIRSGRRWGHLRSNVEAL